MNKSEFAELVLMRLNVIGAGEASEAQDNALVQQAYDFYHAELLERAIANWSADAIPDRIAEPLAQCMKVRLTAQFNSSATFDRDSWMRAERALFDLLANKKTENPTTAEYF